MRRYLRLVIVAFVSIVAFIGISFQSAAAISSDSLKPIRIVAGTVDPDAGSPPDMADECKQNFFGLVPWYQYMGKELDSSRANKCSVKCFNIFNQEVANDCRKKSSDIPGIMLAIIDNLLRISGLVAIGFIIVSSFQYIGSRGNPEATASARNTISNALVGLAIALIAVTFVSFIGSKL